MSDAPRGYFEPAAPPPAPPAWAPEPRAPFSSSIRGPVILIALGTLFALDYMAGISVTRTWPVILILAGLFRLAEHRSARS